MSGLDVFNSALAVAKKTTVAELRKLVCTECGAALVITGNATAECDYCRTPYLVGNMDALVGVEPDPESDPDYEEYYKQGNDSYFFSYETWVRTRGGG